MTFAEFEKGGEGIKEQSLGHRFRKTKFMKSKPSMVKTSLEKARFS